MRRLDEQVGGALVDFGGQAAHRAGQRDRPGVVRDHDVVGVQVPDHVVEGFQPLARLGPAHHDRPADLGAVEGVQRLAELEHQVVGHVHREGDGPDARTRQPDPHPQRRARPGAEVAHLAQHEPVTRGRVGDTGRPDVPGHPAQVGAEPGVRRQPGVGRVGERDPERDGELAGHAADGHAVTAVRGHGDVEDLVAQAGVADEVRAERGVGRQHQDAGVVIADAQLAGGADHALRHAAVGLALADLEAAGQHRAGLGQRHPVADREVGGAADDPEVALAAGLVAFLGRDLAVPDRLLELGQFLDREDFGDDDAADVVAGRLDGLHLEPGGGQPLGHLGRLDGHLHRRILAQPGKRKLHQIPPVR